MSNATLIVVVGAGLALITAFGFLSMIPFYEQASQKSRVRMESIARVLIGVFLVGGAAMLFGTIGMLLE